MFCRSCHKNTSHRREYLGSDDNSFGDILTIILVVGTGGLWLILILVFPDLSMNRKYYRTTCKECGWIETPPSSKY